MKNKQYTVYFEGKIAISAESRDAAVEQAYEELKNHAEFQITGVSAE